MKPETLAPWLAAGALVGGVDAALVYLRAHAPRASLTALCLDLAAALALALVVAALNAVAARHRALRALTAGLVGLVSGLALFSGSGLARLHLTRPLVLAATLGLAALGWFSATLPPSRGPSRGLFGVGAALVYAVHATVLVRQYPLLHGLLAAAAVWALSGALRGASLGASRVVGLGLAALALGAWGFAPMSVRGALRRAPVAQYPALALGALWPTSRVEAAQARATWGGGPPLPLAGRDVVLVTIDALRADRLARIGGRTVMPTLDGLAARGALFTHAWCTTPHTSYSLASIMLGTHARAVMALSDGPRRRETLGDFMRGAGYETAAFYPPAVFAVDGDRFADLRARHFGFGHDEVDYRSGHARAEAVSRWLDARGASQRVFVWVHLFEPHEPYERHPGVTRGDSPEARYDGECDVADRAIRRLREVFDAHHRAPAWIVTADHGEEFNDHGGTFHGTTVYDEQIRVPLVIALDGVAPRVIDAPVSHVDLVPTVLAGVGLARPPRLRGLDLGGVIQGRPLGADVFAATGSLRAVMRDRHKLIVDERDDTLELFDLSADPRERQNLTDQHPDLARALRARVAGWEAEHARFDAEADRGAAMAVPEALLEAEQGAVSAAPRVVPALSDPRGAVRLRAARALGDLGDARPEIVAALTALAARGAPAVADEAVSALGLLGVVSVTPRLAALHAAAPPASPMRFRTALGLARCRDPRGVATLAAAVTADETPDHDVDRAVAALRLLRDPSTRPLWERLLAHPRLSPAAAEALGELGDRRAVEALSGALSATPYPLTRSAAARALVRLESPFAAAWVAAHPSAPLAEPVAVMTELGLVGRAIRGRVGPMAWPAERLRVVTLSGRGAARVSALGLRVESSGEGSLRCEGWPAMALRRGTVEVLSAAAVPRRSPRQVRCESAHSVRVLAVSVW